jgi:hypothetical protein
MAYANLLSVSMFLASLVVEICAHQYIHPTANPTPLSRNLLGNSITGAFTGIRDVISPRQDMTEEMTVPIIM